MASIQIRKETNTLIIDFYWMGHRCREQTALPDTAANRRRLQTVLSSIEKAMSTGTFSYRDFFPTSKNAAKFDQLKSAVSVGTMRPEIPATSASNTPLFKDFAETWFSEKSIEWRASHKKTVRDDIDKRLIPQFGEKAVGNISKADILSFRADLGKVQARGKSTRLSNPRINKILNPLRQILCEAADRFDFRTPFQNIKQLKVQKTDVEPFSLEEVKKCRRATKIDHLNGVMRVQN